MTAYKNSDNLIVVNECIDCMYVDYKSLEDFDEEYLSIKERADNYLSVTVELQGGGSYEDEQLVFTGIRLATPGEEQEYYQREAKSKEIDKAAKVKQYERLKKELGL